MEGGEQQKGVEDLIRNSCRNQIYARTDRNPQTRTREEEKHEQGEEEEERRAH